MNAIEPGQSFTPTDPEALRRLAAAAIARNHHKALARHLASGLDPNAKCARGFHKGDTLLEAASNEDALECFIALKDAGAEMTQRATQHLFAPLIDQRRILSHLLASGELSPHGEAFPGFREITCYVWSLMSSEPASLNAVLAEQAQRERYEIIRGVDSLRSPPSKRRTL